VDLFFGNLELTIGGLPLHQVQHLNTFLVTLAMQVPVALVQITAPITPVARVQTMPEPTMPVAVVQITAFTFLTVEQVTTVFRVTQVGLVAEPVLVILLRTNRLFTTMLVTIIIPEWPTLVVLVQITVLPAHLVALQTTAPQALAALDQTIVRTTHVAQLHRYTALNGIGF
jgi:hypothetical protein